jgi:hypothetical protein
MSDAAYVSAGVREMISSNLMGGTLLFRNNTHPCTVGTFERQDILNSDGGGFSPMFLGDAQLLIADLPSGTEFRKGDAATVTPNTGAARECYVHAVKYSGPMVSLLLRDINESA